MPLELLDTMLDDVTEDEAQTETLELLSERSEEEPLALSACSVTLFGEEEYDDNDANEDAPCDDSVEKGEDARG